MTKPFLLPTSCIPVHLHSDLSIDGNSTANRIQELQHRWVCKLHIPFFHLYLVKSVTKLWPFALYICIPLAILHVLGGASSLTPTLWLHEHAGCPTSQQDAKERSSTVINSVDPESLFTSAIGAALTHSVKLGSWENDHLTLRVCPKEGNI